MSRFMILAFTMCAAAQTPDFSGVWELRKSTIPAAGQIENMKIKIEQQTDGFSMSIRAYQSGNMEQNVNRFIPGQETKGEIHGAPMTNRAEWDQKTLVVHSSATLGGKELRMISRLTLSEDGATLTFAQRHQYGSDPEGEDVRAFERRPASSWEADAPPKAAEEVYKNIQILKGVPAPRVPTVMSNLARWLGVDCAHCHVPGRFDSDEKAAKNTARKMFQMVHTLNQSSFPQTNAVTCWTCHRGQAKPQNLPPQ